MSERPRQDRAVRRPLPRRAAALAVLLLTAGGCADRGLVSQPAHRPATATWLVVAVAVILAGAVIGAVLLGPPTRRPRLASIVLTVDAGIVAVGLAVLVGVILRSADLAQQVANGGTPAGHTLLRLSGLDGDPDLFRAVLLFTGVLGGLTLLLLVVSARFAAGDDVPERAAACVVLGVGLAASLLCVGLVARGSTWWPVVVGVVQLPLLVAALVSCWPRPHRRTVSALDSGYNGRHG
jgi:hypothetical protein